MRSFLNGILTFIGAESLTDLEYDSITLVDQDYDQATYDALALILENREAISTMQDRLIGYFKAKGVDVAANDTGKSNIYIGSVLE